MADPEKHPSNEERPHYTPQEQLTLIRTESGLSMAQMAQLLGLNGPSSYQYYENPNGYKGVALGRQFIERLLKAAGTPQLPISDERLKQIIGRGAMQDFLTTLGYEDIGVIRVQVVAPTPGVFASFQARGLQHLSYQMVRNLTDAEPEQLMLLKLEDPNLFPGSSPDDLLLIDRSVKQIDCDGTYFLATPDGNGIIRATLAKGAPVQLELISDIKSVKPAERKITLAAGTIVPVHGRVIWRGMAMFSKSQQKSSP